MAPSAATIRRAAWCAAVIALGGCGSPAPAPPAVKSAPPAVAQPAPEVKAPPQVSVDLPPKVATSAKAEPKAVIEQPAPPEAEPNQRLLLFTSQGPLLVQLRLRVDGRPLAALQADQLRKLLELSDADRDGQTTWPEALDSRWLMGREMGSAMNARDRERQTRVYDRNLDGKLDLEELARYLSSTGAGGGLDFETELASAADGAQSVLWQALDVDDDRVLSAAELAAAPARLKAKDARDDDLLELDELAATPVDAQAAQRQASEVASRAPWALLLGARAKWDLLVEALRNAYQEDDRLAVEKFPLANLLLEFDTNGDGELNRTEAKGMNEPQLVARNRQPLAPHLILEVDFRQGEAVPVIRVGHAAEGIKPGLSGDAAEAAMQLGSLAIEVKFRDELAGVDLAAIADTQFKALDGNANGYLETDELVSAGPQLALGTLDQDRDGKVYPAEFKVYVGERYGLASSRIQARTAGGDDPLWSVLDVDGDGRLGQREMEQSTARLAALDSDQDGTVAPGELTLRKTLWIERLPPADVRGLALQRMARRETPTAPRPGPVWFVRMDSNADGEISRREFLGAAAKFTELDANSDGYVDRHEAERVGAP